VINVNSSLLATSLQGNETLTLAANAALFIINSSVAISGGLSLGARSVFSVSNGGVKSVSFSGQPLLFPSLMLIRQCVAWCRLDLRTGLVERGDAIACRRLS
jgi:hypothetical protein